MRGCTSRPLLHRPPDWGTGPNPASRRGPRPPCGARAHRRHGRTPRATPRNDGGSASPVPRLVPVAATAALHNPLVLSGRAHWVPGRLMSTPACCAAGRRAALPTALPLTPACTPSPPAMTPPCLPLTTFCTLYASRGKAGAARLSPPKSRSRHRALGPALRMAAMRQCLAACALDACMLLDTLPSPPPLHALHAPPHGARGTWLPSPP